jgi:diguanylate cyclase (GGDEF)-like protein
VTFAAMTASYATRLRRRLDAACFDARHDALTGLANRRLLTPALHRAAAGGTSFSIAFVDIDCFKSLNDTFGHTAGDIVLRAIADRLCHVDDSVELVSRVGGDEFVLMIRGNARRGITVARRAWSVIAEQPVRIGGYATEVRVSVGVAAYCAGITVNELLDRADIALFQAKGAGRFTCWQPNTPRSATARQQQSRHETEQMSAQQVAYRVGSVRSAGDVYRSSGDDRPVPSVVTVNPQDGERRPVETAFAR